MLNFYTDFRFYVCFQYFTDLLLFFIKLAYSRAPTFEEKLCYSLKALLKWWKVLFISSCKFFLFSRYLSFFLDLLVMYRENVIRKIWLISKFITSQPCYQKIKIHVMSIVSYSKGNQTVKFVQLIEYNKIIFFSLKSCIKWIRETNSRSLFVFFQKRFTRYKQVVCSLVSICFDSPWLRRQ